MIVKRNSREAEQLVAQRIHPQTIAGGWRIARQVARDALEASTVDHHDDPAAFRSDLLKIARTTLSSKLLTHEKEHFAALAVDAVLRLKGKDLDHVQVLKKAGGSLRDSYLEEGFLLDKTIGVGQPKIMRDCKILIANTSMDTDKIKIYGSRVKVDSMNKVAEIEMAEKVCAPFGMPVFPNKQARCSNSYSLHPILHRHRTRCAISAKKSWPMDATSLLIDNSFITFQNHSLPPRELWPLNMPTLMGSNVWLQSPGEKSRPHLIILNSSPWENVRSSKKS